MPFRVFNSQAPMEKETNGAGIVGESVSVSTDSNGEGDERIDFSGDLPNDRIFGDSAVAVCSDTFCDIRYDKLLNVGIVDVFVQNAPASSSVQVDVVLITPRS